jgi:septum formation protein
VEAHGSIHTPDRARAPLRYAIGMSEVAPVRRLVLASTSPYRAQLLARLGVPFRAEAPDCDEEAWKRRGLEPRALAEALALAKAESLAARFPGAAILGGDQVAAIDGEALGKPGSAEGAERQLARLSGRTHELFTAVALIAGGRTLRHTEVARLTMRALSPAQIARYVAADDPADCAGAYKLERLGIALFSSVEVGDWTAIVGVPLIAVTGMLAEIGVEVP